MLYIVATPIGNLDDLSIRQAKTLTSSDIILAEDTRSAHVILDACSSRFNLKAKDNVKIISYYKEKEFEKLPEVIDALKEGKIVSLTTDSGLPLISDPGYLLVKTVIKTNLPFTVIPGATAITTALVHSGFNPKNFMFLGFLPKKTSEILRLIDRSKKINEILPETVFIFYESPNRINNTLKIFSETLPNSEVCICRELTKKFEEIIRSKPIDLLNTKFKGELTLVLKLN